MNDVVAPPATRTATGTAAAAAPPAAPAAVPPAKPKSERWLLLFTLASCAFFAGFPAFELWRGKGLAAAGEIAVMARVGELGGFDPKNIDVRAGQTARVSFWAMDVTHSFNLPQLGIDLVLPVGERHELELHTSFAEDDKEYHYSVNGHRFSFVKADDQGGPRRALVLEFKCNRYCSAQHWGMSGTVTVLPPG